MRQCPSLVLALLLVCPGFAQDAPRGFTSLFNGRDLTGWRGRPHLDPRKEAKWSPEERAKKQAAWNVDRDAHWSVENGELINDGHGVFLTTESDYRDFELLLEYKTVAKADSGIYLRATPQVQIWDTTKAGGKWNLGADKGSGGLWNNKRFERFPIVNADRPFGEWNQLRILLIGARTSVWFNGRLIVDHVPLENFWDRAKPLPRTGPIQLQTHGGEIRFRNLAVREIETTEANWRLASHRPDGFQTVFNGRDFTGWKGPLDNYEVIEDALVCRPKKGGTIYTEAEYGDFVARFEFLLPPGGNNGLAIRYPGKGDTAYVGMMELQVLDNTAAKFAGLKPWQFHGSAYGLAPAVRGFQRPVGEWNFQEVTVRGSQVRVELNGSIILDVDVAKIDAPPSGREHPGRTRTRGHFGFAGHHDPVRFRNVRIKSLD